MARTKTKRFRKFLWGGIALSVGVAALAGWLVHARWQQINCGVTLSKAWHIAFALYRSDTPDERFPPMSSVPGYLFPDFAEVYPDYATGIDHPLFCAASDRAFKRQPMEEKFAQPTYAYFGYALQNEDEVLAFLETYPKFIADGVAFTEDLPAPTGKGSFGGDQFLRLNWQMHMDDPLAAQGIPLLIEIPTYTNTGFHFRHPKPGGHVSLLAGGTGFIEYGAEFPMTPAIIERIGELKAQSME